MSNQILAGGAVLQPHPDDIIDFTDMDRRGVVVISPVHRMEHRSKSINIRGFKAKVHYNKDNPDPKIRNKRLWIGVELYRDEFGKVKWKQISIIDGRTYHLENEDDAREWHCLRQHPEVRGSVNAVYKPKWFVEDREKDAKEALQLKKNAREAEDWLEGMSVIELGGFARLPEFMIDPDNNSHEVILNSLLDIAIKTPDRILKYKHDREGYNIMIAVQRGIAVGMIQLDANKGYLYKGALPLGQTPELVRDFLMRDRELLIQIDMEGKKLDSVYQQYLVDNPDLVDEESEKMVNSRRKIVQTNEKTPKGNPNKDKQEKGQTQKATATKSDSILNEF